MAEPADFTGKYNTKLTPAEEARFQAWAKKIGHQNDTFDYDLRGAWKADGGKQAANGHFPDTFKKPNHPTFSTGSKYNGVDGHKGGEWVPTGKKLPNGEPQYAFRASETNVQNLGPDGLAAYFKQVEPGNALELPKRRKTDVELLYPNMAAPAQ